MQFRDVSIAYRSVKGDDRLVFDGLNLEIRRGEKIALIGSNGAGKSTLMKLMVGLLKPGTGDILLNGESTRRKRRNSCLEAFPLFIRIRRRCLSRIPSVPISPMPCRYGTLKNWQARTDELLARFG